MTPSDLASKCAEEVLRTIEFERGIVKDQIAEAIERVLLKHSAAPLDAGKMYRAWAEEREREILADQPRPTDERVYFDARGMPYRYDGKGFLDPKGLRVTTLNMLFDAGSLQGGGFVGRGRR